MRDERDGGLLPEVISNAAQLIPLVGIVAGPVAKRLTQAVQDEQRRNASVALHAAERRSGLSREELAERIANQPRLIPLLTRLLYTAGMTGQEACLTAMGCALGDAIRDPDQVDDCELLLMAMADLREQHTRLLRVLAGEVPGRPSKDQRPVWMTAELQEASPLPAQTTGLCLAGLESAGLARAVSVYGGTGYTCTSLGHTVLEVLDELAAEGE